MVDANVVGSGPNGLAAALTLAKAGLDVVLTEASDVVGGGLQTRELTGPGYLHDVCSAVHPAAVASPFFRAWGLENRVDLVTPEVSYAHPLDGGRAGIAWHSLDRTVDDLGRDGREWRRFFAPLVKRIDGLVDFTGSQLLRVPRSIPAAVLYGLRTLEQGLGSTWNRRFDGEAARAMITGVAAHTNHPQPSLTTSGAGILLAAHAHAGGWAVPMGGSQSIADAMVRDFEAMGGRIRTGTTVRTAADLEPSRITLLDTTPQMLARFTELPARYRRALGRFRYGQAAAKVDFALSGPVPWTNAQVHLSPTVHVGGSREEIVAAEHAVEQGRVHERPYVLAVQPSVVDPSRAPEGHHVLWTYTHVPNGSTADVTEAVIRQIERFAPGFRDLIVASNTISAVEFEQHNANYIGGDIFAGALDLVQLVKRPVVSRVPWRTPVDGLYLCSASTAPGPAVHGMNGWYAADVALGEHFGMRAPYRE
ncbi:NAD(P)/FAD-dependent oxidoreductase [Salinibacterium sp. SYSU T00001]|uniref:phytoene desaturase family protein n=1 Tax=Homoserinimonas sedimenticola TaxID=2986805 RepID=UPI0022368720|nr:NAD(P)/FAD-dependent oxidoreductase [Salinibacterium sedimenticola]MCW4386358.1 NAD(P)/FAD-dependent oxidoreductase [Salinibacterium sedimenticola]